MTHPTLMIEQLPSALGDLLIVGDGEQIYALEFADCEDRLHRLLHRRFGPTPLVQADVQHAYTYQLAAYLDGELDVLDAITVCTGGTPFQQQLWQELRMLPPGVAITYGEMAVHLGRPSAARAVGTANGLNPVNIVVPCHRLVGANGSLTGYSGGLERKAWLLRHEGAGLHF